MKRAGRTVKISVSLDKDDFATLEERAARLAGGNISAALGDLIQRAKEWEGREKLADWLGEGRAEPDRATRDALRNEWLGKPAKKRSKKKANAA